jgi:hypothetical protein
MNPIYCNNLIIFLCVTMEPDTNNSLFASITQVPTLQCDTRTTLLQLCTDITRVSICILYARDSSRSSTQNSSRDF